MKLINNFLNDFLSDKQINICLPVSFIFPPAAAVTVPLTVAGTVVGAASYGIGHATENEKLKEFGKDAIEVAGGAVLNDPTGKTGDFIDRATGTKK